MGKAVKEVKPNIVVFDIETAPFEVFAWGIHDQIINLSQVKKDRSVLCWAAKRLGDDKVIFEGTGGQRDVRDDRRIMKALWTLLNEADVVITQNGKKFDVPIVNGRFLVHGFGPVAPFRHIDTCQVARKLGLTSSRLEYLTNTLCPELAKSKHNTFPGFDLWKACLGEMGQQLQKKAWREMEAYNKQDVRGTEGVYYKLAQFGFPGAGFDVIKQAHECPECGSTKLRNKGYYANKHGMFQCFRCTECGHYFKHTVKLLTKGTA